MTAFELRSNHQSAREIEERIGPDQVEDLTRAVATLERAQELVDEALRLLEPIHQEIRIVIGLRMLEGSHVPDDVSDGLFDETSYGEAMNLALDIYDRLDAFSRC